MSATPFRKKDRSLSEWMVKGRISTFAGSAAELLLIKTKLKVMMIEKRTRLSFFILKFDLLLMNLIHPADLFRKDTMLAPVIALKPQ